MINLGHHPNVEEDIETTMEDSPGTEQFIRNPKSTEQ